MNAKVKLLNGIKEALFSGKKVNVALNEASTLTGSGDGIGGRTQYDDAFAALRYANPFRMGARQIKTPNRSAVTFVAKTGNAIQQSGGANPWGYTFTADAGSPNTSTAIWQLPTRNVSVQLPIRLAAFQDINGLDTTLVDDLVMEFGLVEGYSMAQNNDQSGTTTTAYGGTSGLRGLDMYSSGSAAYGSSGTAITNGIHTILTTSLAGVTVTYAKVVAMANSLPAVYWAQPTTAWMVTPALIQDLRNLKDTSGLPLFLEMGEPHESGAVGSIFGWPVIPNPYMSATFPMYLASWEHFLTIADVEDVSVQTYEQTAPGFVTLFAQKRLVSTVRDVFAGVRASAA